LQQGNFFLQKKDGRQHFCVCVFFAKKMEDNIFGFVFFLQKDGRQEESADLPTLSIVLQTRSNILRGRTSKERTTVAG
jgi:hypothetical protein